ncbi:hypothetical protein LCGC14_1653680 [marine sediment metagenome]|uniref:Portal protein n=1 Tax=marine sediment metagenome TaxID=412755 RepID=A0A0F9HWV1_9ZZZZ
MPDNMLIEKPEPLKPETSTPKVEKKFKPEDMKKDVIKWVTDSRTFYADRFKMVDEYVKRYEAKRSISGLMGWGDDPKASPKDSPWKDCSDVGIPLEAFTIEGLLPRFLKVCYGSKPIVWVRGETDDDLEQAKVVQEALNFQVTKKIKIYRRMKNVFKNVVMQGDGFAKCVWEEEYKIINKVVYYVVNPETGELYLNPETNEPITVTNDADIPPVNEQGMPQVKVKQILSERKKIYDNPKIYSRNIKQIIIPKDANTPEIDDLDWICDTYERTIDWCKRRVGDEDEGKFNARAVREMEEDLQTKNPSRENHNFSKILISEWHGRYDVNDDGMEEEVIVFIGSTDLMGKATQESIESSKLLGWMISPYPKRPFFHYQIIPMDDSFYGKGVPEFLIGIRNLVDAIFNQMLDRGSITNNPPTIVPPGHDPDENPFGPGAQWVSDNPLAYRVLELPKSEQIEFKKMEFLLALVQKLFGTTDFTPPPQMGAQRTATGIMTIVSEGNIKFDDMIRALQDVNEDLYDFIVQLNADLIEDEFVFMVTGQENPFKKINKKGWVGNFDFEAVGNSININREIEQNRATIAYRTGMESFGKNPAITPSVMLTLTDNFFTSIDMRNIKLPTIDEIQQQRVKEMAMAIQENERMNLEKGQRGQTQRGQSQR